MKTTRKKQLLCIAEKDAATFQTKVNAALAGLSDPEIILDQSRPFTLYAFYTVRRDEPESILELLEMLDTEAKHATCIDCPMFRRSPDRRRKWGHCRKDGREVRLDARPCEYFYRYRHRENADLAAQLESAPYLIE